MGEGDRREPKRALRYDSRAVIQRRGDADGNDKAGSGAPKDAAAALISRTATLDDPLTTSLLAEVTRRSVTVEVSPDQIDEAIDQAEDPEPGDRAPSDDPA